MDQTNLAKKIEELLESLDTPFSQLSDELRMIEPEAAKNELLHALGNVMLDLDLSIGSWVRRQQVDRNTD